MQRPRAMSLRPVWERPTVSLDTAALDQFATTIYREDFPVPSWREPVFPADDDERLVNFIGVGNTTLYTREGVESTILSVASPEWLGL